MGNVRNFRRSCLGSLLAGILISAFLWLVSACTPSPPPLPTDIPVTPTRTPVTPRPFPLTRSAPTLPPTYTATVTFTPLPTATDTPTPSITPTFTTAEVCETVTLALGYLNNQVLEQGDELILGFLIEPPDAVLRFQYAGDNDEEPNSLKLAGGDDYFVVMDITMPPGEYEWTSTVTTDQYTDICQERGSFTVVAPEPPSPLVRLLMLLLDQGDSEPSTTPTAAPTASSSLPDYSLLQTVLPTFEAPALTETPSP